MKVVYYLFISFLTINYYNAHAQVNSDMQAMHMIKDFYTAYSSINLKSGDTKKLDSLIDKYFTPKERERIKSGYDEGHDIMTTDSGITKRSIETMIIRTVGDRKAMNVETGKYEISKGIKNAYEVSYVVNPLEPKLNETISEPLVVVYLLVVNYNDVIKISYVTDNLWYHKSDKE